MSFVGGPIAWRLPIACQVVFAFIVIILVFGLPESPRYLYARGRHEEALQVLCDVYNKNPNDEKIVREQADILSAINKERERGEYQWSQLLKPDAVQTNKRVLMAYLMQFMNQMGGINLVVYYITSVLQENVGLSRNLALLLGGAVNAMFFFGSLIPTFFLDRLGRRGPMMWGSAGLGLSMMMIAILLSFKGTAVEKNTASASIAFFFLYMLIFGASVNCIPWVRKMYPADGVLRNATDHLVGLRSRDPSPACEGQRNSRRHQRKCELSFLAYDRVIFSSANQIDYSGCGTSSS
jgi:hypothetical protein